MGGAPATWEEPEQHWNTVIGTHEPHLGHDHVLALLDVLPVRLHDGLEEPEELDMAAVGLDGVDEVVHHAVADVVTQLEVVHEDVAHGLRLQQLTRREGTQRACGA